MIPFPTGAAEWAARLFASSNYFPVGLTVEIVVRGEDLYAIAERGDRLIAATAMALSLPLVTRDPAIRAVTGVRTIW